MNRAVEQNVHPKKNYGKKYFGKIQQDSHNIFPVIFIRPVIRPVPRHYSLPWEPLLQGGHKQNYGKQKLREIKLWENQAHESSCGAKRTPEKNYGKNNPTGFP